MANAPPAFGDLAPLLTPRSVAVIDAAGAFDLLGQQRTLRRLPDLLPDARRDLAAPFPSFTFEVNPLKVGDPAAAVVDGLLLLA